jgi:DNA-directed RNA polymerase subunit RPC12/RpoP
MKLTEFITQFPDESSCKLFFKQKREQEGISCKRCGSKVHYWLQPKEMYQCKITLVGSEPV